MAKKDKTGMKYGKWTVVSRFDSCYWNCRCECGTEKKVHGSHLVSGRSGGCGCRRKSIKINAGDRFGKWTVLHRHSGIYWTCRCECGTERAVHGSNLAAGSSKSCGCWSLKVNPGDRFGKWTVIRRIHGSKWQCKCECGAIMEVWGYAIAGGKSLGCNCRKTTHGMSRTALYRTWVGIRSRCTDKNNPQYRYYGEAGVSVCERWDSFENFFHDMGKKPSPSHSIDRWPDPSGNYEPGNCRWATVIEQNRNKRKTVMATIKGVTRPVKEWCEINNINYETVLSRISRGWSDERSITEPVKEKHRPKSARRIGM